MPVDQNMNSRGRALALIEKLPDQALRKEVERSLLQGAGLPRMVGAFHKLYGLPIVHPAATKNNFEHITRQRLAMRFGLIVEEFMELCEAMDIRADINFLYLDEDDHWVKAKSLGEHAAEESSRTIPDWVDKRYDEEYNDSIYRLNHDKIDDEQLHVIVRERLQVAIENTEERNMVGVADACGDLKYVIQGFELEVGIPSQPVLEEIQASNMSKLNSDGTVKRRADGKVLKGENYFEANIEKVLRAHGMKLA